MARGVNIFTSNWTATGKNISVPQYSVEVRFEWVSDDGTTNTRTETLKFPNFLSNVGGEDLKNWLTELLLREAMQRLGI